MSGNQDQPPTSDPNKMPLSVEEVKGVVETAKKLLERLDSVGKVAVSMAESRMEEYNRIGVGLASIQTDIIPLLKQLSEEQDKLSSSHDKLRGVMLGKMDGLQGTIDLLRQDVHNSWGTADFAIRNSTNVRDDIDKILNLMSTMQKQQ